MTKSGLNPTGTLNCAIAGRSFRKMLMVVPL